MTVRLSFQDCKKAILNIDSTIKDAAESLTSSSLRICLVLNEAKQLLGVVSDGDIRRGLLRQLDMSSSIKNILNIHPLVVPAGFSNESISKVMIANNVFVIPEIDDENHVSALHIIGDSSNALNDVTMVIMAGGKGKRLRPHTNLCPKPMLPVMGKPMLEHIILQAISEGIKRFIISVNYLSHIIEDYFKDGSDFNVNISYLRETSALGTAGSLSLLQSTLEKPIIITNCDIISDIEYLSVFDFHERQQSVATMAVRIHETQNQFGVVQLDGLNIIGFEEKPTYLEYINAGVYCLSPEVLTRLVYNEYCDMPSLFQRLQSEDKRVLAYPMHEPWVDVGRPDDLLKLTSNV